MIINTNLTNNEIRRNVLSMFDDAKKTAIYLKPELVKNINKLNFDIVDNEQFDSLEYNYNHTKLFCNINFAKQLDITKLIKEIILCAILNNDFQHRLDDFVHANYLEYV